MKTGKASRTALITAAARARASSGPGALCDDSWAFALAGAEGRDLEEAIHRARPALSLYVAVRTAFVDAQVRRFTAAPASFEQVVLLGAGLDTRAARLATRGVRFFEVDHRATQLDKRERLRALAGYPVDAATFVECDFGTEGFLEKLIAGGFDAARAAVIVWEGVTMYLDEPGIRGTLRTLTTACDPRSILLFDHLPSFPPEAAGDPRHVFLARLGETLRWGTDDALPMLHEEGFRHVQSLTFDELCLAYTGTHDGSRGFHGRHMVVASRATPVF